MELQHYIQTDRGNATRLATSMGIPISYLSQMASGARGISPERAWEIEKLTNGAVTRQALRRDDFWRIWPDLAHLQPLPALAQTKEAA